MIQVLNLIKTWQVFNLDAFEPLVNISMKSGVHKFIYASSSSVYGIKKENVVENMELNPLTDYSKFKAECEKILFKYKSDNFITTVVRPATVCGYSKDKIRLSCKYLVKFSLP